MVFFSRCQSFLAGTCRQGYILVAILLGSGRHQHDGNVLTTTVHRRWPRRAETSITIQTGDRIAEPDELSVFLSARWGLYSRGFRQALRYAPVDHETWPLYSATLQHVDDSLVTAAGLSQPSGEAHVMFSPGVSVRIGLPRKA